MHDPTLFRISVNSSILVDVATSSSFAAVYGSTSLALSLVQVYRAGFSSPRLLSSVGMLKIRCVGEEGRCRPRKVSDVIAEQHITRD